MGGEVDRTGSPLRFRAGVKRVRMAHAAAAEPKPCPGSATTVTVAAAPVRSTTTRRITVCSSICSASASRGHGQDQFSLSSDTGLERSGKARGSPAPGASADRFSGTAELEVPVEDVTPPAYAFAVPRTRS
jgi:hypothetical protein